MQPAFYPSSRPNSRIGLSFLNGTRTLTADVTLGDVTFDTSTTAQKVGWGRGALCPRKRPGDPHPSPLPEGEGTKFALVERSLERKSSAVRQSAPAPPGDAPPS